jgi:hypothetical protein
MRATMSSTMRCAIWPARSDIAGASSDAAQSEDPIDCWHSEALDRATSASTGT